MLLRSSASRNRLAATALVCGLCLGAAVPYASAADHAPIAGNGTVFDWKAGSGDDRRDDLLGQVLVDGGPNAIVVVTPGTDDIGLHPRIDGIVGSRDAAYIRYPESFWPIITGRASTPLGLPIFAPTYGASSAVAMQQNLTVMELLQGYGGIVVYTGYSQGSEALGNAAEKANANGWLGTNTLVLLVSDPRSPWGVKGWARDLPLSGLVVTPALGLLGIGNDGARDPGATGDVQVISVIVQGDPVADWQWKALRPVSSLLVNLAGFVAIHSPADGPYGHLDGTASANGISLIKPGAGGGLAEPTMLHSADGKTAYAVYDTYHPLALLNAMILGALGIKYTEDDLARWDRQAQIFYPMTDIADKKPYGGIQVGAGNGGLQPIGSVDVSHAASGGTASDTGLATGEEGGSAGRGLSDGNTEWAEFGARWTGPGLLEAEPTPIEPAPIEPIPTEPTPTEPTPIEPTPIEPTPTEVDGGGSPDASMSDTSTGATSTETGTDGIRTTDTTSATLETAAAS